MSERLRRERQRHITVLDEVRQAGAREAAERILGILSLSDQDPSHVPQPGLLSDRRALFLSGWHERAAAFRKALRLAGYDAPDPEP